MSNKKWPNNPLKNLFSKLKIKKKERKGCSNCTAMDPTKEDSEGSMSLSSGGEGEEEWRKTHMLTDWKPGEGIQPRAGASSSAACNRLVECRPHTQVDYYHFLVPGLTKIISSPHYWGKMDRYEAESELENKPEGSFLLRDSAQDDYIFSVSFRRYGRSLHARIEESDHLFSFDCHDPSVFKSPSIPELLKHYKDPTSFMFFEPLLCCPVNRNKPFSLQDLSRAVICDRLPSYSSIDEIELPRPMKNFLKEYHYKHKIRTRRLD